MEKIGFFCKTNLAYLVTGSATLLVTGLFYLVMNFLWNSITEFYAIQSNDQIMAALSKDIAEGNYFGFTSTLGRIKMAGSLKEFGIIENDLPTSHWLHVSSNQFKEKNITAYACSESVRMISQQGSALVYSSPIPASSGLKRDACLILEFELPATLTTLKRIGLLVFGFVVLLILAGQVLFLTALKRREFASEQEKAKSDLKLLRYTADLARQVSHDIRSPLSALNMVLGHIAELPESQRLIIRNSVNRINDIANQLLIKSKTLGADPSEAIPPGTTNRGEASSKLSLATELLSPLVDSLVSEKRIQFRENQSVIIESDISQGYGLFATISPNEFNRVLSNLVNNSIESFLEGPGRVIVAVKRYDKQVCVIVQDNGCGIPEPILNRLGEFGVSYGKEDTLSGSGLGVYHAKKTIESFGGSFKVTSKEGEGTVVTMSFPRAPAPQWFVEKLSFTPGSKVATLDDDLSIHDVWKNRFSSLDASKPIEHIVFTSGQSFINGFMNWYEKSEVSTSSPPFFLVDYELLNQAATGLDIVEELGIGPQTILVTSRYDEPPIRQRCENLGVKLIPKSMVAFVPIEILKPKLLLDACLIDDDPLIEMVWKTAAADRHKSLQCFSKADDFLATIQNLHPSTPIYVDANLGDGVSGLELSKQIFDLGFENIFLCTGYDPNDFPPAPWLKGILGKDPVF